MCRQESFTNPRSLSDVCVSMCSIAHQPVTGKILLCNGCGIRWRRTSGKERKKRIKPGPKRAGESPSSSSAAAELGGKSVLPSIRKCFTSSSSTTSNSLYNTPPGQYVDGIRRGRRTSPSCAKMDLKHLLCATSVGGAAGLGAGEEGRGSKERSRLPSRTRSAESSQIGIRIDDLVNDGEEMEPRRAKSEDGSFVLPASLRLGR